MYVKYASFYQSVYLSIDRSIDRFISIFHLSYGQIYLFINQSHTLSLTLSLSLYIYMYINRKYLSYKPILYRLFSLPNFSTLVFTPSSDCPSLPPLLFLFGCNHYLSKERETEIVSVCVCVRERERERERERKKERKRQRGKEGGIKKRHSSERAGCVQTENGLSSPPNPPAICSQSKHCVSRENC